MALISVNVEVTLSVSRNRGKITSTGIFGELSEISNSLSERNAHPVNEQCIR